MDSVRCPRCGTVQDRGAVRFDLCPACLLSTALTVEEDSCPYEIRTPIAEDADGTTYLAEAAFAAVGHVALKIYHPRRDASIVLARYQHWKPAIERVRDRSIARLLAVGLTTEDLLYVASEYVTGWPLSSIGLRAEAGMSERIEIARQLTSAIGAAHEAGVVHLKLDASRVRVSTLHGVRATILGLGTGLIVNGLTGGPDIDRAALEGLIRGLGVTL